MGGISLGVLWGGFLGRASSKPGPLWGITIPMGEPETSSSTPGETAGDRPIIIVDDSPDDLAIARRCYEKAEIAQPLRTMQKGQDLIDLVERVEAGEEVEPWVVLLDIKMPPPGGFEVLERVRGLSGVGERMKIVMFSTSNDPRDLKRAMNLGASGFVTKPMALGDYMSIFRSLAG